MMEGPLFKWTNYVSGWQQRWFAIEGNTLSYYRSPDEVNDGCKGSVKLSACDVVVHSSDLKRFDLIIGSQRFYLRALSEADRQRWIVALGSRKVCASNDSSAQGFFTESKFKSITAYQSELRMYHSLMQQQIKELQSCLKEDTIPDIMRVNEITGTLDAACAIFMATLNQLLVLTQPVPHPSVAPDANFSPIMTHRSFSYTSSPRSMSSSQTIDTLNSPVKCTSLPSHSLGIGSTSPTAFRYDPCTTRLHSTLFSTMDFSFESVRLDLTSTALREASPRLPADGISAWDFVKACRSLFNLFEHFSKSPHPSDNSAACPAPTAMQQVRLDLLGYLDRLELAIKVYTRIIANSDDRVSNPYEFLDVSRITIGTLVRDDLANDRTKDEASAYKAILSLGRSLNFTREFLHLLFTLPPPSCDKSPDPLRTPDDSLSVVAAEAYYRCLRAYHQWSLRGVANIIIKSLPSRDLFLRALMIGSDCGSASNRASSRSDKDVSEPGVYAQLTIDAKSYSDGVYRILAPIEDLFSQLNLEHIFTGSESR